MTTDPTLPRILSRQFEGEADWQRVRSLLIETHPITGPDFNWEIRHWEGNRYHNEGNLDDFTRYQAFRLWETEDGHLAGVAHVESSPGEISLQIHPTYRAQIEAEMIAWSEEHCAAPTEDGRRQVEICVFDYDAPRLRILQERGYQRLPHGWVSRRMHMVGQPIRKPVVAEGYQMRTVRLEDSDCQKMADLLNAAFNRPNFHQAGDYRNFMTCSPSFRQDLHLVMEAPDGSFAAHVGMTYDEANRYAIFEPVCTHDDHRRKGLAQAMMLECLHRVRALGACTAQVATGDGVAANALYESIGFTETYRAGNYQKVF